MGAYLVDALDPNLGRFQSDAISDAPAFEYKPGFVEGSATAVGKGLLSGLVKTLQLVDNFAPNPGGVTYSDPDPFTPAVKALRPDPKTTGTAGQILHSLADVLPRTVVGTLLAGPAGGAAAAGVPEGYSVAQEAKADGVDPMTADIKGLIQGAALGFGTLIPGGHIVKNAARDFALTVGANVGLGVAERAAVHKLLQSNGYEAMARQYEAWDATAIITDAVLGSAFWGVTRATQAPSVHQIDAALTQQNAKHLQVDSAPGLPADFAALDAHVRTMEGAVKAMLAGEPVRVDARIGDASFIRAAELPENLVAKEMRRDYADVLTLEKVPEMARAQPDVPFVAKAVSVTEGADTPALQSKALAPESATTKSADSAVQQDPLAGNHIVQAAKQTVERMPDLKLRVIDENGNEMTVTAKEWIKKITEDDMRQAQTDTKGVEAAVQCFMRTEL